MPRRTAVFLLTPVALTSHIFWAQDAKTVADKVLWSLSRRLGR
jgi:hypothetical protein